MIVSGSRFILAIVCLTSATTYACATPEAAEDRGDSTSQIRDADDNEVIVANKDTRLKTSTTDSSELTSAEWCDIPEGTTVKVAAPSVSGKHVRGNLISAPGCGKFEPGTVVYLFRSHFDDWTAAAPDPIPANGGTCSANAASEPAFVKPLQGSVTSRFGDCRDGCSRKHAGVDVAAEPGTTIVAPEDGVVIDDRTGQGGCGTVLEIQHANGSSTRFCHNQGLLVKKGQCVTRGQAVARVGNTGIGTGPHMHLEYYPSATGAAVNPAATFGY